MIVISLDGFGATDLDIPGLKIPNIRGLEKDGLSAEYLKPVFSTLTFPNHWSMVTGAYEDQHGILDNFMWDPVLKKSFSMREPGDEFFQEAETIFGTANRSGIRTFTLNWPASDREVQGYYPTYWSPYDESVPYKERIDRLIQAMEEDDEIRLGMTYFEEPDKSAHFKGGPKSQDVKNAIEELDGLMGYLRKELHRIKGDVNLVVLSDHGLVPASLKDKGIYIPDYLTMPGSTSLIERISAFGAVTHIWPKDPARDSDLILKNLSDAKHMTCSKKEDLRDSWHYKSHRRVSPVVCVSDSEWMTYDNKERLKRHIVGWHGYDNEDIGMRAIFFAAGPQIARAGKPVKAFEIVHIYALMAHVIGIPEKQWPKNSASVNAIRHILRRTSAVVGQL